MEQLIFYGYEFAAGFIPFIIALAVWSSRRKRKKNGEKLSKTAFIFAAVFAVYIMGVYHFTGAGTFYEMTAYRMDIRQDRINVVPFSNHIDIAGYLLNIVLFIPLGLLTPFICERMNKFFCIPGESFLFSLFIEATQLLNNRATDIDDLILNTVGGIVGFVLFKIFDKCTKSKYGLRGIPAAVIMIGIIVPFIGRFFLFNEMGFAKLMYGF